MGGHQRSPVDQVMSAQRAARPDDTGESTATVLCRARAAWTQALRGAREPGPPRRAGPPGGLTIADVPRLLRGLALLATGLETVFAPGRTPGATVAPRVAATPPRPGLPPAATRPPGRLTAPIALMRDGIATLSTPHAPGLAAMTTKARQTRDAARQAMTTVRAQVAAAPAVRLVQTSGGVRRAILAGLLGGGVVALLVSPLGARARARVRRAWGGDDGPGATGIIQTARQTARRGADRAAGRARQGLRQVLLRPAEDRAEPDDVTLVDRVESEIFHDPAVPKGRMNINAEQGRVVLRGEVDQPEQISAVEAAVRTVPGVRDVENLLHLPDTPAPQS